MAGPLYRTIGTRTQSAGATSLSPTKPTVDGTGGILIAVVSSKNNATHSTVTSGWSLIGQVNSGASFTSSIWSASESAAAPTFTWTGSVACSAQIAHYSAPDGNVSVGASTSNNGTTSTHSTSSINTTANNSVVIYADASAANTAMATPSGWTENVDAGSATDAGRNVWGNKLVATSGSASGAISVTGANAAWVQWQVELLLAAATGYQASKLSAGAWLDRPQGYGTTKISVEAWLDQPHPYEVSRVTVSAWLDKSASTGRRRQIIN